MSAYSDNQALAGILNRRGINITLDQANTLRRAQMTLHRWHELECGDGNDFASWSIERDEQTQVPYMCTYPHDGKTRRSRIPDREAGAIKRIAKLCKDLGISYYVQTDPRGCALYVSRDPIKDNDYTNGVACCV